ncbi:hypothetical protein GWN42_06480 [candidate division KSB1 bacterium]|nr:hypothetical protein [candidate division KSB1 bacterium]
MIRANCRDKFTAEDFDFIVDVLASDRENKIALNELLTDAETRDQVLDDRLLFQRVLEKSGVSKISPYFYFYVLTRRVFTEFNLDDRNMADYVASMLAEFGGVKRAHTVSKHHSKKYFYLTDMMLDFTSASSYEAFLIRSHLGNYALFLTGIFPDYVYRKSTYGRKAPGIDYYEEMGSSSYRWASQHKMAIKYSLVEILANLAHYFRNVRIALNKLADDYMVVDEKPDELDKMLRQIFYGNTGNSLDA